MRRMVLYQRHKRPPVIVKSNPTLTTSVALVTIGVSRSKNVVRDTGEVETTEHGLGRGYTRRGHVEQVDLPIRSSPCKRPLHIRLAASFYYYEDRDFTVLYLCGGINIRELAQPHAPYHIIATQH